MSSPSLSRYAQQRIYATQKDLDNNRVVITRLWSEENKPLKYVIDYMTRHHNLSATTRQYKTKLKAWGLKKYKQRKNSLDGSRANIGRVQEHQTGRLAQECLRASPQPGSFEPSNYGGTACYFLALPVGLPDQHEYIAILVHNYFEDSLDASIKTSKIVSSGTSDLRFPQGLSKESYFLLREGTQYLNEGNWRLAFRCIDASLFQFQISIRKDPFAIPDFWRAIARYFHETKDSSVVAMVLTHLHELCVAYHGPNHPHSRLAKMLAVSNHRNLLSILTMVDTVITDARRTHSKRNSATSQSMAYQYMERQHQYFFSTLGKNPVLDNVPQVVLPSHSPDFDTLEMAIGTAVVLLQRGQLDSARDSLEAVEKALSESRLPGAGKLWAQFYSCRAGLHLRHAALDKAELDLQNAILMSEEAHGSVHAETLRRMGDLQRCLDRQGKRAEVDQIKIVREEIVENLSDRVKAEVETEYKIKSVGGGIGRNLMICSA